MPLNDASAIATLPAFRLWSLQVAAVRCFRTISAATRINAIPRAKKNICDEFCTIPSVTQYGRAKKVCRALEIRWLNQSSRITLTTATLFAFAKFCLNFSGEDPQLGDNVRVLIGHINRLGRIGM